MRYEEAMQYLSSNSRFGIKSGLSRTLALASALGHPERSMRYVHIAGTNGKGSVSVMVESALRHAGIRTGLFTSPHLSSYTERIRVDGTQIGQAELAALVSRIRPIAEGFADEGIEAPTEFELCTAFCLEHFKNAGVKLAVMEVGLGGRYDSTNIIEPDVAVIAHISYDHMERLGKTLAAIAFDKCGIIKPGAVVVASKQTEEADGMIRREALAKGASLFRPGRGYEYRMTGLSLKGTELDFSGSNIRGGFETGLVGVHQADNAAAALAALDQLIGMGWQIDSKSISEGLKAARHPGRFEVLQADQCIILDGAHNPDGAEALSATLATCMGGAKPVAVMGFSADKPYKQMLQILYPEISRLIATGISHARSGAVKPEDIASAAAELGIASEAINKHEDALAEGLRLAGELGVPLLICGSLYLIGEMRGMVLKEGGADPAQ